jgi:hypothetical protein
MVSNRAACGVEFRREQRVWDERFRVRCYKRIDGRNLERASGPDGGKFRPPTLGASGWPRGGGGRGS